MTSNPFLGVVFHWLGGLAAGSFYVPIAVLIVSTLVVGYGNYLAAAS